MLKLCNLNVFLEFYYQVFRYRLSLSIQEVFELFAKDPTLIDTLPCSTILLFLAFV